MRNTFLPLSAMLSVALVVVGAPATLSSIVFADAQSMHPLPAIAIDSTSTGAQAHAAAQTIKPMAPTMPARLIIPSIGLNAPIEGVGVNTKGEMAVPSGKTDNVGWYKYGTRPGAHGTAVLDAHVFAAFSNLRYLKPGADIYVVTSTNQIEHFVVAAAKVYALGALTGEQLFSGMGAQSLNLITCAGSLTKDHSTYDHRLVIYTTLVS